MVHSSNFNKSKVVKTTTYIREKNSKYGKMTKTKKNGISAGFYLSRIGGWGVFLSLKDVVQTVNWIKIN